MEHVISVNAINPIIRKAGLQKPTTFTMPYRIILDYEFIYCASGQFMIDYQDSTLAVPSGQIAIIPPDTLHRFLFTSAPLEAYWVHFDFVHYPDQQAINQLIDAGALIPSAHKPNLGTIPRPTVVMLPDYSLPPLFTVSAKLDARAIFQSLYRLHEKKTYGWQLACKEKLIAIIMDMLEHLVKGDTVYGHTESLVESIEAYIQTNIYRHLTIGELADHFHYHPDTLTRLFKERHHQTLKSYIAKKKIESTKNLLTRTNYPIETIAEMYGYTDRTYYSKVFKKLEGMTPSHYRRTTKKSDYVASCVASFSR